MAESEGNCKLFTTGDLRFTIYASFQMNFPIRPVCAAGFIAVALTANAARTELNLSGPGWNLWADTNAVWQADELFLPPVNLAQVPGHPPTGGWQVLTAAGLPVSVPGTVEEYLSPGTGPAGDYQGVSWWWRTLRIPENAGPHVILRFESQRQRAEVYLDQQLVGYDLIGGTPFTADLTGKVHPGQTCQLAVRITDPGGNFDWRDTASFKWGNHVIPISHGFGGITGPVQLVATDPVFVDDIDVQNTPAATKVTVFATIQNTTGKPISRDLSIAVLEKNHDNPPALTETLKAVALAPGATVITQNLSLATAKLWDLAHPNLYTCPVGLAGGDTAGQTFGFRWFAPEGFGSNALFRLNGKRIVLRTAISWGFWPINGIFPTPELADRQIRDAKAFGLNMLNFHRAIGQRWLLDKADELGLLYYEEPGGYQSADDAFSDALMREKVLRMVKRDRSHPSLVIYSLINERNQHQLLQPRERADLLAMHALDPARTITLSSSWAKTPGAPEDIKANMRPLDGEIHFTGWFDVHHAGGPEVWRQNLYASPTSYYNYTTNRGEIVYWGEEGAISSPPQLEKIRAALAAAPAKGWDGEIYLDWYRRFDHFLSDKNLRAAFPTVASLTTSMGAASLYHQGRKIETIRIGDVTDGYAINGWESESIENHSGIVDCWRNPKADPAIIADYNQPLYVAVKARRQITSLPGTVAVDCYGINELNLHGDFTLHLTVLNPARQSVFATNFPVKLSGGDVYGELLTANTIVPIAQATGFFQIQASLTDAAGQPVATGHDEIFAVDWQSQPLPGIGATWEGAATVRQFLAEQKGVRAASYRDDLGRLDWVVVTRPPAEGVAVEIPAEAFGSGLQTTFFADEDFHNKIHRRIDPAVDFAVPDGSAPDAQASVTENYTVRWEGRLTAPLSGDYTLSCEGNEGVRLYVNDQLLFDDLRTHANPVNRGHLTLAAGQSVALRLDLWHRKGNAQCKLLWSLPEAHPADPGRLLQRVHDEGTTLVILDRAEAWMPLITNRTAVQYHGSFAIGTAWLGGLHFVRAHPLFQDLPVDTTLSWPYQAVVRNGRARSGLRLDGEELVAGAWHSYPMELGTAVGIIPYGRGKIIVSTLDIASQLNSTDTSTDVARKLLCNFLRYSGK